jgi:transcription termination factor Rho
MSESVLERSVLERKEREELQTIARAMGAEPPARAKKADLVDLILQTAGIDPSPAATNGEAPAAAPETPRRRTRRAEAPASATAETNGPTAPTARADDTTETPELPLEQADAESDGDTDAKSDDASTNEPVPTVP